MNSDSSDSPLVLTPESTGTNVSSQVTSLPNSPAGSTAAKKSRRQTAFYPNVNSSNKPQKPFSRSAARRESVMALGSIEHLQYFFTKTGLAAKKNLSDKAHLGLVPAIGGRGHVPATPSITTLSDLVLPSPSLPSPPKPQFSRHIKDYDVDPESLLPGVIEDLISMAQAWKLEKRRHADNAPPNSKVSFDVLEVLKITTRAIRSTRNYLLSLPDESGDTLRAEVQFRSRILGSRIREPSSSSSSSTAAAPSTSTSSSSSQTQTSPDSISRIRRSALEVLTVLRQLEETYRLPLDDEAYDAQSDGVGHSRGVTTSFTPLNGNIDLPDDRSMGRSEGFDPDMSISFSLVQVQGEYKTVPVWEDDEDDSSLERDERKEKKDGWEERLVLGTGWLYRQDVHLSDLEKERGVVSSYLNTVDEVLFNGAPANSLSPTEERGWEKMRRQVEGRARNRRVSSADGDGRSLGLGIPVNGGKRRVSTGMVNLLERMDLTDDLEEMDDMTDVVEGEDVVSDDELPKWARRSAFVGNELGRVHALLAAFLPSHLLPALKSPNPRSNFLQSLSSGQLLCVVYNACVRKSKKPWGYVSKDSIHDILALETTAKANGEEDVSKRVWTFRRTDNLRLWVGALKLRYMLPVQMPFQPLSKQATGAPAPAPFSSSSSSHQSALLQTFSELTAREPPILFDAKIVAKRDDGWEDMLETVLLRWVEKVVEERRSHQ